MRHQALYNQIRFPENYNLWIVVTWRNLVAVTSSEMGLELKRQKLELKVASEMSQWHDLINLVTWLTHMKGNGHYLTTICLFYLRLHQSSGPRFNIKTVFSGTPDEQDPNNDFLTVMIWSIKGTSNGVLRLCNTKQKHFTCYYTSTQLE